MPSKMSFQDWCSRRLLLMKTEKALFKLTNQISLEILLTIGASSILLSKSEVYELMDASEVAVRMHLKALQANDLILVIASETDHRVEKLALSPKAQKMFQYCKNLLAL